MPLPSQDANSKDEMQRGNGPARKTARRLWRTYQWPVVLTLLGFSFLLGYIGFAKYLRSLGSPSSPLDTLYLTVQLATLESGSISGPLSWELELARWMAPLLTAYTAVLAVATLFSRQLQMVRLRFLRDHVVICGLGQMGSLLADGFCERGMDVVVIERDAENRYVELCRENGGVVLIGDAAEEATLRKAGVQRARHIVSVCGEDGVNTEVAVAARRLAGRSRPGVLTCSIHLINPQLYELLREQTILAKPMHSFRLALFNVFERGAAILHGEYPAFDPESQSDARPPHILIIGLGQLGEGLLIHVARAWYDRLNGARQKMTITVIDHSAVDKTRALESRFSQLSLACDLIPLQFDIRGHEFEQASFLMDAKGDIAVDRIYICLDDHSLGLQAALRLRHNLGQSHVPIVVRMPGSSGLAKLIQGEDPGKPIHNIHTFDLLQSTCTPDLALAGTHELLARAIHAEYLRQTKIPKQGEPRDPARVPWEDLPEDLQESNRQQVDHISAYLHAAGYAIKPLSDWNAAAFEFAPEETDRMARLEHQRWFEERTDLGWRYEARPKDPEAKTHPLLVEWESLPPSVREDNLRRIERLPSVLASHGFQVYRVVQDWPVSETHGKFS